MIADHDRLIIAKYPDLFDLAGDPGETAMSFGFQLNGEGWLKLLDRLCADLQILAADIRIEDGEFKILQIKQKLGTLRVAYRRGAGKIQARIDEAKAEALQTCEICGEPGEPRSDHGSLMILCRACHWEPGESGKLSSPSTANPSQRT